MKVPEGFKERLKNLQSSLAELTEGGTVPAVAPPAAAPAGMLPGPAMPVAPVVSVSIPLLEAAVMLAREFLGHQHDQFQQMTHFLMQRVERLDQTIARMTGPQQAGQVSLSSIAIPSPPAGESRELVLLQQKAQELQSLLNRQSEEAGQNRAEIARQQQTIAELQNTIGRLEATLREAEQRHQQALRAKEEEMRIALASKRGTAQIKEAERRFALEVARLQQVIAQKEQEKQKALDLMRGQLEQATGYLQTSHGRIAEMENVLKQKEQKHTQELEGLQQQIKARQQQTGRAGGAGERAGFVPERDIEFLRELLGACPLFKNFKPVEISLLVGLGYYEEVGAGEMIVKEGSPADYFYIVIEGKVQLTKEIRGESQELLTAEDGDVFGEGSLIKDRLREATAIATCPTKLLRFAYEDYWELARSTLPVAKKLSNNLLHITNERSFLYA